MIHQSCSRQRQFRFSLRLAMMSLVAIITSLVTLQLPEVLRTTLAVLAIISVLVIACVYPEITSSTSDRRDSHV